jgi:Tfp pilus assembly protein FimV
MSATATSSPLRLTRRGRVLLVLLLAGLLLAAFSLGQQATQAAGPASAEPAVEQTTVQPGESLWSVAQRIAPDNDPREVIAQIRRLNDLQSVNLRVGQQLLLPRAA